MATVVASVAEAKAIKQWPASITPRRLKLSAMAPARIERKNAGRVEEDCTSATIRSEAEIVAMSQLMAVVCTSQPRLEICVATKSRETPGSEEGPVSSRCPNTNHHAA
ncbi:hypothetical protein GGE07_005078 [Sinorhizobium terangae]|nr:hypothetical protein [Sinorhizobium terangae]